MPQTLLLLSSGCVIAIITLSRFLRPCFDHRHILKSNEVSQVLFTENLMFGIATTRRLAERMQKANHTFKSRFLLCVRTLRAKRRFLINYRMISHSILRKSIELTVERTLEDLTNRNVPLIAASRYHHVQTHWELLTQFLSGRLLRYVSVDQFLLTCKCSSFADFVTIYLQTRRTQKQYLKQTKMKSSADWPSWCILFSYWFHTAKFERLSMKEKVNKLGRKQTGNIMSAYLFPSLPMHILHHAQTYHCETNTRKRTWRECSFACSLPLRRFSALFSCGTTNQKAELDRLLNFKRMFRRLTGEQHNLSFQGNHNSRDKLHPGHSASWLCPPTRWYKI